MTPHPPNPAPSPSPPPHAATLRLGARGSLLSRMQSAMVARALEAAASIPIDIVPITTSGDTLQDRPLHEFGGKGLFTKELEQALLRRDIDFAVHSFKDVPVTMPLVDTADLLIASVPPREDPRDLLASHLAQSPADLPQNARVGTSSLRRQAQLLALRPDLQILPIRGNIDTRLRKLREGQYDAIILALAGVKRADLFDPAFMTPLDPAIMLPAAGQGALALECRRDAPLIQKALAILNDPPTALAASLEREVVRLLNGDCHSPIAALATLTADTVTLQTAVAARDGRPPVLRAAASAPLAQSHTLPQTVVSSLQSQGVSSLLNP